MSSSDQRADIVRAELDFVVRWRRNSRAVDADELGLPEPPFAVARLRARASAISSAVASLQPARRVVDIASHFADEAD